MTDLPIDFSKTPMRSKYLIDETSLFKEWFIFGEHPNGYVDVSDGTNDIFINVPKEKVERLLEIRYAFTHELEKWYHSR